MPLQNRITPSGEIIADPARGLMMGNRGGALHRPDRTLTARRWVSRQWICCRLLFKDRKRQVMAPGRYTELFFLDEATALAAGHRPCFECRRADAEQFATLWSRARGVAGRAKADAIDTVLHAERLGLAGAKRMHPLALDDLPDGVMILDPATGLPALVLGRHLLSWNMTGYGTAAPRPRGRNVESLTPPGIIAVLQLGYRPELHGTAGGRS